MKPPQNTPQISGRWYRCSEVKILGGDIEWKLNRTGRYNLLDAYGDAPHQQLIASPSDDFSLQQFIKAWGPLEMFPPRAWEGKAPVDLYRNQRDRFLAWTALLAAVDKPAHLREKMCNLLRVSDLNTGWIRSRLMLQSGEGFDDEICQRIFNASQNEVDDIVNYIIGSFYPMPLSPPIVIDRSSKIPVVRAVTGINSLVDALYWMVWQDYFKENPYSFCAECQKIFPSGAHGKKYCEDICQLRREKRDRARRKKSSKP